MATNESESGLLTDLYQFLTRRSKNCSDQSGLTEPNILPLIDPTRHWLDERILKCQSSPSPEDLSRQSQKFIEWARSHKNLKVVSVDVPPGILPAGLTGRLHDIRIFSRGPDDALYDSNEELRNKVARGNCFLELVEQGQPLSSFSCLVYALKKFTGGLGDDDDREQGDEFIWKRYFTKSVDEARSVVCTKKINGEAAHLGACLIRGEVYLCAGSKNVHMLFRTKADLALYDLNEQRYSIAREICVCLLDTLDAMEAETKQSLFEFVRVMRLTGVFEILNADHPHVVDLSYLTSPCLKFIAWSSTDLKFDAESRLSKLPPDVSIEIARSFGLNTIDYDIIDMEHLDARMLQIRQSHGEEGEVLCFLDEKRNVIGLLKKKSIWYIVVRAIREKFRGMCTRYAKVPASIDITAEIFKTERRIDEIQKWLGLNNTTVQGWKKLAAAFFRWSFEKLERGELTHTSLNILFPVHWQKFLCDSNATDVV